MDRNIGSLRRSAKRGGILWIALMFAISAALFAGFRPDRAIRAVTGLIAHDICSKTFVSNLDPDQVFAEAVARPGIHRLRWMLRYDIDRSTKAVRATLAGWGSSRAVFRDGLGCITLVPPAEPYLLKADIAALKAAGPGPLLAEIAGPSVVEPFDVELKAALDHAFEEPDAPPYRRTKAVVVVHDGAVIAERYAPGIGIDTPLAGYSMTKSVVNALIGRLVQQGRLSVSEPAPVAEWRQPADPRHAITIEHLMRMTSGLALDDAKFGFDPSSQMLYLQRDMAAFAAAAILAHAPGTRWAYSSPSMLLLSRIIRDSLGGVPERTLEFAWRELFNPLGMRTATLEFDATGTLEGAVGMLASARDWARFGLLYLQGGSVGGHRLLPEGWIEFSAKATLDTDYGAGFWTNRSDNERAKERISMGVPRDAFYAFASLGQVVMILPAERLVIVRLGDAVDEGSELRRLAQVVRETVSATQH
jgi:CubicO group peptidase (beta-lactamase class C family)